MASLQFWHPHHLTGGLGERSLDKMDTVSEKSRLYIAYFPSFGSSFCTGATAIQKGVESFSNTRGVAFYEDTGLAIWGDGARQ